MTTKQITIYLLRILIGSLFIYSGLDKLLTDFSATGYLMYATTGPFTEFFQSLAGSSIIDFLVVWGEILIGFSIVLGLFVRFASVMGILQMVLFYLSTLPQEHGPISQHIIYIMVFIVLIVFEAGRTLGFDQIIERKITGKNNNFSKFFLG